MSYLITAEAVSQDGVALTMTDGGTIGITNAIITFDSTNSVCDFNNNIGFATGKGILDSSANEQILFTVAGSAVNYLNITNAATGAGPAIAATGSDSNVDLDLDGKGQASIRIGANSALAPALKLFTGSGGKYNGFSSSSGQSGDVDYTLPTGAPAANGYVLSATTAGVMSWAADSGGLTYNYDVSGSITGAAGNLYAIGDAGGTTAISLPAISGLTAGDQVVVKDIAGKFNGQAATLTPNGSDTIDGAGTLVLDSNYQSVTLRADTNTSTWGIY